MRFKSSSQLTLRDKLSRLTLVQAQQLLGPRGAHWLAMGGKIEIDSVTQVRLTDESCQISFPEAGAGVGANVGDRRDPLVVKVALHPGYRNRLQIGCNRSGDAALLHQGASLAMLLEEKTSLGLAAAPIEDTPWELLSEELLESRALAEREQRSLEERMTVKSTDSTTPWTDYLERHSITLYQADTEYKMYRRLNAFKHASLAWLSFHHPQDWPEEGTLRIGPDLSPHGQWALCFSLEASSQLALSCAPDMCSRTCIGRSCLI